MQREKERERERELLTDYTTGSAIRAKNKSSIFMSGPTLTLGGAV